MKVKSKIALVLAVVVLLFLVGWTSRAQQSSSRTNWEYKAVTIFHHPEIMHPNMKELNDIGDEGWELVTTISSEVTTGKMRQIKLTCYFKRPR